MKNPTTIHSTTQQFLDIFDITNDIVILKNGSTSLILQVNAVNFGLLAEAEQDAIIYAYAGLLNSLSFPIEIMIRSQTKDVSHYLQSLQQQEEDTLNERRKAQIKKYRAFVSDLIRDRNVLDKKFYVVIPASALELGLVSAQSVIPGVKAANAVEFDKSLIIDRALTNLYPKRDHLVGQFARIGLYARQLVTQEIIHLFYTLYNPESSEGQAISNTQNYTTAVVQATMQGDTMTDTPQQPTVVPTPPSSPNPLASAPVGMVVPTTPLPTPGVSQATAPFPQPELAPTPTNPAIGLPPLPNLPQPVPVQPAEPTITPVMPTMTPVMPTMPAMPTTPHMPTIEEATEAITGIAPAAAPKTIENATPFTPPAPDMLPTSMAGTTPMVPSITPAQTPMPMPTIMSAATSTPPATEDDAQSLINNTLQQIDPTALSNTSGVQ